MNQLNVVDPYAEQQQQSNEEIQVSSPPLHEKQEKSAGKGEVEEGNESGMVEPPRRLSVVEMWRRRDNQSASASSTANNNNNSTGNEGEASPFDKNSSSNTTATNSIRNSMKNHKVEEDEKKEEDNGHKDVPKTSVTRNVLNRWANPTTTTTPVSSSPSFFNKSAARSVVVSQPQQQQREDQHEVVDMSIVQSPSKLPLAEEEPSSATTPTASASPSATKAERPSNVVSFWAQRGLKPINSGDDTVTTAASSVVASWKQREVREATQLQSSPQPSPRQQHENIEDGTEEHNTVEATTPRKMSVVDRWKQRVSSPARSLSDAEQHVPTSPAKKSSVVERWTSVVKKPEPPVPKTKVSDRWINRQQQSNEKKLNTTPKRKMSISGIPASPTSRTYTTASSVTSWRSAENWPDDDATTAAEGSEVCPASPLLPAAGQVIDQQHVIKRWSNRFASESSRLDTVPTATATALDTPTHPGVPNSSSLPAPRRKGGANTHRGPHKELSQPVVSSQSTPPRKIKMPGSFQYSPIPLTPKTQPPTPNVNALRTPDPKTFLPDLKKSSTPKSSPRLRPQISSADSPNLKPLNHSHTPTSTERVRNLPDFNNLLASPGGNTNHNPPSPLSPSRRSVAALSPKFRYELSSTKSLMSSRKNWITLDGPQCMRSADAEGGYEPRLLVLISGQSLSRGQASTRQQISTILNGHGIPYEEIDGSISSVRDQRNELFKLSGLWAQYPQFFIREKGQTVFWGTWETLQQCNDAGKIVEEFTTKSKEGQNTPNIASLCRGTQGNFSPDEESRFSRVERIKRLAAKRRSPASTSSEDPELIPPLLNSRSQPDDEGSDRVSMTSPSREPRSNYDIYDLRKISPGVAEMSGRTRMDTGGKPSNLKIGKRSTTTDQSVNGDSVAQTIEESVVTESTAPRLGAKSLDSLERREKKASRISTNESAHDYATNNMTIDADLRAIFKPTEDETSFNHLPLKNANRATSTSWPPPKNTLDSSSGTPKGTLTRILSPHLSSPQTSYKANQEFSRKQESPAGSRPSTPASATGSPSSKQDFDSSRSRRIGQRLIEKKRELQAHRQRIKKTRSTDSSDGLSVSDFDSDIIAESLTSGGVHHAFQTDIAPAKRSPPTTPQRSQAESDEAYSGMHSTSTPSCVNRSSCAHIRSEVNPVSSSNLSRHNKSYSSASKNAPWSSKSAFSPLNDRSARQGVLQPTHTTHGFSNMGSTPTNGLETSAKDLWSPVSESGFSFVDIKSDCSNSVTSRGSALSIRAEKLLKQRRQKRNLDGVEEETETSDGRRRARELARNVVYGRPNSTGKSQKWSQLRVDTIETEDRAAALGRLAADATDANQANFFRSPQVISPVANFSAHDAVDTSLTRQRATLSSRYTTSDRFMDQNAQNSSSAESRPPPTTKSLPDVATPVFDPYSTRSAPERNMFNGLNSGDTQDDTGASSEEFHSLSSQTSRTESAAPTSRRNRPIMSGIDSNTEARSHHGIHDDFVSESAYSYDALRDAYSRMTLGQLAADIAGEVSNALNLDKIQDDVKKAFGGSHPGSRKTKRPGFVCTDLVPYDEEDVAIEVEYMEDSFYGNETVRGLCEAKGCGVSSPTGDSSFESPPRRRRVGEV